MDRKGLSEPQTSFYGLFIREIHSPIASPYRFGWVFGPFSRAFRL